MSNILGYKILLGLAEVEALINRCVVTIWFPLNSIVTWLVQFNNVALENYLGHNQDTPVKV